MKIESNKVQKMIHRAIFNIVSVEDEINENVKEKVDNSINTLLCEMENKFSNFKSPTMNSYINKFNNNSYITIDINAIIDGNQTTFSFNSK